MKTRLWPMIITLLLPVTLFASPMEIFSGVVQNQINRPMYESSEIPYNVVISTHGATYRRDDSAESFFYVAKQQIPIYDLLQAYHRGAKRLYIFLIDPMFDKVGTPQIFDMLGFKKTISLSKEMVPKYTSQRLLSITSF